MDDSFLNDLSVTQNILDDEELKNLLNSDNSVDTKEFQMYLKRLYHYYKGGGWGPIISRHILNICNVIFQIITSYIFVFCFNWTELLNCDANCGDIVDYIAFSKTWEAITYMIFGCTYTVYTIITSIRLIKGLRSIDRLCCQRNITQELNYLNWETFYRQMGVTLQPHDVAQKIMQQDNFIIALINNELIETKFYGIPIFNHQLETIFRYCIFNVDNFAWHTGGKLTKKFKMIGWLYALALPVILPLTVIYSVSRNIDILYIQKQYLGPRTYPLQQVWLLRQYNELPHFLYKRLKRSEVLLNRYFKNIRSPSKERIAKAIQVFTGTILMFIIIISILDDNLLLGMTIWGKSVLWHLAFWVTISTAARTFIPDTIPEPNLDTLLLEWSGESHYLPNRWYRDPTSKDTINELGLVFPTKLVKIGFDILGCILTPYILIKCWASASGDIIDFIHNHSYYTSDIGQICTLSSLDLNTYGNERYGPQSGSLSEYSKKGKLEKSIINFGINYQEEHNEVIKQFPGIISNGNINMVKYMTSLTS